MTYPILSQGHPSAIPAIMCDHRIPRSPLCSFVPFVVRVGVAIFGVFGKLRPPYFSLIFAQNKARNSSSTCFAG